VPALIVVAPVYEFPPASVSVYVPALINDPAPPMFGKMIGTAYAEGFITEKMIGVRDFEAFIQMDT